MTFVYDTTTALGQVRLQIGDTTAADPLFTDAEVQVYLDLRADNILLTAADLCDVLAIRFSREFDFETDRQKFSRSQRQKMYAEMASSLRVRANSAASIPTTRVDGYSSDIASDEVSTQLRTSVFFDDAPW